MNRVFTPVILLSLAGCQPGAQPQAFQMPPLEVPVANPVMHEVLDFEEYTGKVTAIERVNVMARVDGYLAEIRFTPGQLVKKNDVLVVIDRRQYQAAFESANGQLAQAEARVTRLSKDFTRVERLNQSGAGTAEELDKVTGDLAEARASVAAAKASVEQAKLNLDFCEVRAPVDGRVGWQMVTVGNLVQGSMPSQATILTELVSVDSVYVNFDVPERDVLRYRRLHMTPGQSRARDGLSVDVGLFDETGYPHKGIVDFTPERVEQSTGTQTFRAIVANPQSRLFADGMFARVRIAFSQPYQGLVVSDRAVVTNQGSKVLYVINDKNIVEERPVQLGRLVSNGLRHVRSGLQASDRIAVGNLQRLMPGAPVVPVTAPMTAPTS
ncbi:MAG: efflux RND transporter periplasmic adaptor subunit [Gemmataceae bacterium]